MDDISSAYNTTNIVVRVIIREVVIQLYKGLDKSEKPYLMLRADRLRLDAALTEHGVAAHASLGAVQLVDKIHVGTDGEYMELLSTKEGTDLISILYRKVSSVILFLSSFLHEFFSSYVHMFGISSCDSSLSIVHHPVSVIRCPASVHIFK